MTGLRGGAFANVQTTYDGVNSTKTQAGWTVGAGVEWAFANNWTAKLEYLYVDLGTYNASCATSGCTILTHGPALPFSVSEKENLIRGGVNFKFNF